MGSAQRAKGECAPRAARCGSRLRLAIMALLCAWATMEGRVAAQAGPSLRASQDSVAVEVGSPTTIAVVANPMPAGAMLEPSADRGVHATAQSRGAGHWLVSVSVDAGLAGEGLLTLELRGRSHRTLAAAQVRVIARPRPTGDALAQATLILDGDELIEGDKIQGLLAVANRSGQALRVGMPRAIGAPGMKFVIQRLPGLVLPDRTLVAPLTVQASGSYPTAAGKHVVGLVVPVTSDLGPADAVVAGASAGRPDLRAEMLAIKELNLTIPGVSAVTGVLQVPSLLLLPGMLAIATFFAIWGWARPRPVGEDPLNRLALVLSPALWIGMIMLSGGIGVVYWLISGRNVLYAYGLRDVIWLWFGSIAVAGLVGWIAYCREKRRQARAAAPRFAPGAEPIDVLAQVACEGRPWRMRSKQAAGAQLFDLGAAPESDRIWACGRIAYRFAGQADTAAMTAVRDAVTRGDIHALRRRLAAGEITLTFVPFQADGIRIGSPLLVSPDLFNGNTPEDDLMQEAP